MRHEAARPHRPSRLRHFVLWWVKMGLLISLGLCGAFGWFVYDALRPAPAIAPRTDGIVALTGGQGRVDMSLRLLMQNRGDKLLISGVDTQATKQDLLPPQLPEDLKDRVTLGYLARSTIENASETAAWVADNRIHTLTVVTAGYHMRRALVELRRTLPGVTLYPYPVIPPALERPLQPPTLRLLLREFAKWLGALAGFAHTPSHVAG